MVKKIAVALAALLVLLGPSSLLLGMAVLLNPAAQASCLPGGTLTVGPIPDSLTATTANGQTITLNRAQLTHAGTIITVGGQVDGVGRDGVIIALMAALTESSLRMLANPTYPDSSTYPNDGMGSDHDSLGLFQMRPQSGWGSIAELMDPNYQAKAFFGGPAGPNYPSPRGLLDIDGWQQMAPGEAAQAVEVSAFPDRYANYQPVAERIVQTLTAPPTGSGGAGAESPSVPETSRVVFPLPTGSWVKTDDFGPRTDPITGAPSFHAGTDLGAPGGTPIIAAMDGRVAYAGMSGDTGTIRILSTIGGQAVGTTYLHMWPDGILVAVGQTVTAGQQIGEVGSSGHSTGNHLHFEVHPGGVSAPPIDAMPWLTAHGAVDTGPSNTRGPGGCGASAAGGGPATAFTGPDSSAHVSDPTGTGGFVTKLMAHLISQAQTAFPATGWSCLSPRPGQVSEHSLGRACDVTVGNQIGSRPTPSQLDYGSRLTNWLKTNAKPLGVQYLIWQGHIWNIGRDNEGWRPYNGGGMYDPGDVTGGHYDHIHITVRE